MDLEGRLVAVTGAFGALGSAVTLAAQSGQLELNAFLPLIAKNLFEMLDLLNNVIGLFVERCVRGIEADRESCQRNLESGYTLATALVGRLGYDKASEVAAECRNTGKTVRDVALGKNLVMDAEFDALTRPEKLTAPGGGTTAGKTEEYGWT